MATAARPGEMKTRIRILKPVDHKGSGGYRNPEYRNIYEDDRTISCKWTGDYGKLSVEAHSLGLRDTATLTLRYNPRITADCIVAVGSGDQERRYDLFDTPNDIGGNHRWMELRVQRRAKGL